MWRRAEGDPNNYLVLGKNIMDRNQAGRMTVELVNDEDIDGPGKIINVLHDIFYPIINSVNITELMKKSYPLIFYIR